MPISINSICNTYVLHMPTAKIRKSGNSIVLVVPPDYLKEKDLHIGDEVSFEIFHPTALQELWGRGKHLKINAQQAKNYLRKQW